MGKAQAVPVKKFPYRISKRLNLMSAPRKDWCLDIEQNANQPAYTPHGIRKSALRGPVSEKIKDVALPSTRRLILTKKMYGPVFSKSRLSKINRLIEMANMTPYAKLANVSINLKKSKETTTKKKRGWTESDWAKHMTSINALSTPKDTFEAEVWDRGPKKPLAAFQPRLDELAMCADFKKYRRLSKEDWYRDPIKVPESALKYVISDRVKKLAAHKVYAPID